jgi:uncharacterized membrane protein YphA (DoxX/SURF4 family)
MEVARIVLDLLLAAVLLMTGGGKVAGAASSHAIRDSLRVAPGRWKLIGSLELIGVVGLVLGLWFPATALAASIGVAALMIGAIIVRKRAGESWFGGVTADVVVFLLAAGAAILNARAI